MQRIQDELRFLRYSHRRSINTVKALAWPVLCPVMCCWWCRNRKYASHGCIRDPDKKSRRRNTKLVEIHFRRRKRDIEAAAVHGGGSRVGQIKGKAQLQSSLFAKLPAEIRLQIYQMVLCGSNGKLHISRSHDPPQDRGYRCLVSVDCRGSEHVSPWHQSCIPHESTENQAKRIKKRKRNTALSLLVTCRAIYREAISVLYSNAFIFSSSCSLRIFAALSLPLHLNTIREIHLNYGPKLFFTYSPSFRGLSPDYTGTQLIDVLSSMYNLRTLYVLLGCGKKHWFDSDQMVSEVAHAAWKLKGNGYATFLVLGVEKVEQDNAEGDMAIEGVEDQEERSTLEQCRAGWPLGTIIPVDDGFSERYGLQEHTEPVWTWM